MTHDAKMASEGTFEPCENGTNDPAVQRSLAWAQFGGGHGRRVPPLFQTGA